MIGIALGLAVVAATAMASRGGPAGAQAPSAKKPDPLPGAAKYLYGADWQKWIGKKADPKKPPIYLGWINLQAGIQGRPHLTRVADVAVKLLNNELGGVGGHPVVLVKCLMAGAEEEGQKCAQQLVNDSRVKVIAEGDALVGGASFFQTLDGKKPVVGTVPYGAELAAKNAYMLTGGITALGGMWTLLKNRVPGGNTLAFVNVDTPITRIITEQQAGIGKTVGWKTDITYYPAAATDLVGPLTAANINAHDAAFAAGLTPELCISLGRAWEQLRVTKPTLAITSCLAAEVKQALGDWPKWTYIFYSLNPFAPHSPNGPVALYLAAHTKYGKASDALAFYSPLVYGQIFTMARVINSVGPAKLTGEAFAARMASFPGPSYMVGPDVKFGEQPFPAIGNRQSRFFTYLGNGKWKDEAGGRWLLPPS